MSYKASSPAMVWAMDIARRKKKRGFSGKLADIAAESYRGATSSRLPASGRGK